MQYRRETPKRNYKQLKVKPILDLFQSAKRRQDTKCHKCNSQFKQHDKEISYRDGRKHVNYHHYPTRGPCVSIMASLWSRDVATRAPPQKPPELKSKF